MKLVLIHRHIHQIRQYKTCEFRKKCNILSSFQFNKEEISNQRHLNKAEDFPCFPFKIK